MFGLTVLVLAGWLRLLLRRVWIADLLTSVLFSFAGGDAIDFSNPYRFAATVVTNVLLFYAFLWMLRRLGDLTVTWHAIAAIRLALRGAIRISSRIGAGPRSMIGAGESLHLMHARHGQGFEARDNAFLQSQQSAMDAQCRPRTALPRFSDAPGGPRIDRRPPPRGNCGLFRRACSLIGPAFNSLDSQERSRPSWFDDARSVPAHRDAGLG
jgi:hypothetical protein